MLILTVIVSSLRVLSVIDKIGNWVVYKEYTSNELCAPIDGANINYLRIFLSWMLQAARCVLIDGDTGTISSDSSNQIRH